MPAQRDINQPTHAIENGFIEPRLVGRDPLGRLLQVGLELLDAARGDPELRGHDVRLLAEQLGVAHERGAQLELGHDVVQHGLHRPARAARFYTRRSGFRVRQAPV
jgi:hypothetical protein